MLIRSTWNEGTRHAERARPLMSKQAAAVIQVLEGDPAHDHSPPSQSCTFLNPRQAAYGSPATREVALSALE